MTAEDKIHAALLASLIAATALVFTRPTPESSPAMGAKSATDRSSGTATLSRAELELAITPLHSFVRTALERAATPLELGLALHGLGGAAIEADSGRALRRLSSSWTGASEPPPEAAPEAVLGTLMEAGVPLHRELGMMSQQGDPAARPTSLGELVARFVDSAESREAAWHDSPWRLDLLAFATLADLTRDRERLAKAAHGLLRQLELLYRDLGASRGSAELEKATLARAAETWDAGELEPSVAALHASAAVFRAVAVLDAPDLAQRARRHLGALTLRYQVEREIYPQLLARAARDSERERIHLVALERLGRLAEALYHAHLGMSEPRSTPSPALARLMRQVARDLLNHWSSLRESDCFSVSSGGSDDRAHRVTALRAAVHALRGLRSARVAV